ncbi:MAG: hydroxymethylglutaryl-CoA synthase [Bdellovibrio sp.]|nr:MAG: hydroxymethylglutaryl-CoA synthase [Bdellovibrio sp.]
MAGIVGYGAYVPHYRITTKEIAGVWGESVERIEKGLGIKEKAIAGPDEDSATIAVEAARIALERAGIDASKIGAVYVGSESHPYAVKATATIVAEAVGATPMTTASDLEFACKAGTAGMQMAAGLVDSSYIEYGLAIGADTAQGRPGDALEYSAASGGAAYIIGKENGIAEIEETLSYTTDTPDFWRRNKANYPSHGGRFTGEPGYFKHLLGATQAILEKTGYKVRDFDYVVFHQPNAKFPLAAAKKLGIDKEKILPGLLVPIVGNTYSGASPLGLANVLDMAKPGSKILMTSFGSGAGSDSFIFNVTDKIEEARQRGTPLKHYLENKKYVNYAMYAKMRGKIKLS